MVKQWSSSASCYDQGCHASQCSCAGPRKSRCGRRGRTVVKRDAGMGVAILFCPFGGPPPEGAGTGNREQDAEEVPSHWLHQEAELWCCRQQGSGVLFWTQEGRDGECGGQEVHPHWLHQEAELWCCRQQGSGVLFWTQEGLSLIHISEPTRPY